MKTKCLSLVALVAVCIATVAFAQETICIDGKCQAGQVQSTIYIDPLREELTLVDQEPRATAVDADRFLGECNGGDANSHQSYQRQTLGFHSDSCE